MLEYDEYDEYGDGYMYEEEEIRGNEYADQQRAHGVGHALLRGTIMGGVDNKSKARIQKIHSSDEEKFAEVFQGVFMSNMETLGYDYGVLITILNYISDNKVINVFIQIFSIVI